MTKEEIQIFKEKIVETIMPAANNMTEEQITNVIKQVEKNNPELPIGFANMILEQILILKYNKKN